MLSSGVPGGLAPYAVVETARRANDERLHSVSFELRTERSALALPPSDCHPVALNDAELELPARIRTPNLLELSMQRRSLNMSLPLPKSLRLLRDTELP